MIDRARLRALAEAARDAVAALDGMGDRPIAEQIALMRARNGALGALEAACTPHDILALLDALDAAERGRDEARERQRVAEVAHGAVLRTAVEIVVERDALAADARRWQAIDAHWRTAQCYFRKDATNSIRAVQMFIDFDHRNDGKALGGVVDEAIAALAAREPT